MSTVLKCPNCAAPWPFEGATKCQYCDFDRTALKGQSKCSNCGAQLRAGAEKCDYCKYPVAGMATSLAMGYGTAIGSVSFSAAEEESTTSLSGMVKPLIGLGILTGIITALGYIPGAVPRAAQAQFQQASSVTIAIVPVIAFLAFVGILMEKI